MNTKTLSIPVKQEHIDNGVQGDPDGCAVSLAIQEFSGSHLDWIGYTLASITVDGKQRMYAADEYTSVFVGNFDDGEYVEPFTAKFTPLESKG